MIIGAPQGTYPGGLSDLPPLVPEPLGGLVYQCDVGSPGNCNGLLSTETDVSNNDRRLFDGDREFPLHGHVVEFGIIQSLLSFCSKFIGANTREQIRATDGQFSC